MTKNVISGKLKGFELSYLEIKVATLEIFLREPHYRDGNFKFSETFISKFSEKFFQYLSSRKKILKKSYVENYKDLSSHIQRQDSQLPLRVPSQFPIIGFSKFWKFLKSKFFFENF